MCDASGLTASQIIRTFISLDGHGDDARVVVFDRNTAPLIQREMRKWGHHYNQAVHALNRIAFYAERGSLKSEEARQLLFKANSNLREVHEGSEALAEQVAKLMEYELVRI